MRRCAAAVRPASLAYVLPCEPASPKGAAFAMTEQQGSVIAGKYELLEELGTSAAGSVYRVRHGMLDAVLAVTALAAEHTREPEQLERIQATFRRASKLRHEHVVPVVDLVEEAGRYHVVEAAVDGLSLARVLADGGPLAPADALHVARQLADALAYAHERGVVHGALTPACVLLEATTPPRALLAGFATASMTWQGDATPADLVRYAAPERLSGVEADARADIFSFGLVLFEMLEGKPFLTGREDLEGTTPFMPRF